MQSISIQLADNGLIKIVEDDNINAAGEVYSSVVVYDFESGNSTESKINFLYELALDAGVELGNPRDKSQIKIKCEWGDDYEPTNTEIEKRITELKSQIKELESMLK